jgi:hypothetical protein
MTATANTIISGRRTDMEHLTVSDVARALTRQTGTTIAPHQISDLFYKRLLDDEICPIAGNTRLIPASYVAAIEGKLRERGVIPTKHEGGPPPRS